MQSDINGLQQISYDVAGCLCHCVSRRRRAVANVLNIFSFGNLRRLLSRDFVFGCLSKRAIGGSKFQKIARKVSSHPVLDAFLKKVPGKIGR